MIVFKDLDPALSAFLKEIADHPDIAAIGVGKEAVMVYVVSKKAKRLVETRLPEDSRSKVKVQVTGKPRILKKKDT